MAYELELIDLANLPPAGTVLGPRERAFYDTLRFPKRRLEWLGGRCALKQVVARLAAVEDVRTIEVLPQETGKPMLFIGDEQARLSFSITHSNGYAAAAASRDEKFLGIDLEKIAPRINSWKESFFHASELTGEGDAFLTALWTQKEAVVKLLGTGLSLNSFDVRCINSRPFFFGKARKIYEQLGSPTITLHTVPQLDGFMFSVAYGN